MGFSQGGIVLCCFGLPVMALELPTSRVGQLELSQIILGMWQVSGGWGDATPDEVALGMVAAADAGYVTFDMADFWGPTEELFSIFKQRIDRERGEGVTQVLGLTKWAMFQGQTGKSVGKPVVERAISRALRRMGVARIDMLQFHWGDGLTKGYVDALKHLVMFSRDDDTISEVSVTNFNTDMLHISLEAGVPLVSNQVQLSVLDQRALRGGMLDLCRQKGVKLLAYGVLCGGLLTDKYLDAKAPTPDSPSKGKYLQMIELWGGWDLFQKLLWALREVADKYGVDIAHVAMRWVLDLDVVACLVIGCRFGLSEHYEDNRRLFSPGFEALDEEDKERINQVTAQCEDLLLTVGNCGDEFR